MPSNSNPHSPRSGDDREDMPLSQNRQVESRKSGSQDRSDLRNQSEKEAITEHPQEKVSNDATHKDALVISFGKRRKDVDDVPKSVSILQMYR